MSVEADTRTTATSEQSGAEKTAPAASGGGPELSVSGSPFAESPYKDEPLTRRKIQINLDRNRAQDHTEKLDQAAGEFSWEACRDQPWNPESFALLWGTPIWDQASDEQRLRLNQLYWVAYYAQIISAEIATIFFNQTSAAGLFGIEDFRSVCDMLDLESSQERAHIAAFKRVAEAAEQELFGERIFTYPMRGPYAETMICGHSGPFKRLWKSLQLRAFGLLSSGNAYIAAQYFLIRGLRTLNGKLVQHALSEHIHGFETPEDAPVPSRISFYHFQDESYHFNSSTIISHDLIRCLKPPTAFERMVTNMGVKGCQKDHRHFSVTLRGIFWHDPATFRKVERVLTSRLFGLDKREARELMRRTFTEESEGIHASFELHRKARESYKAYVAELEDISERNKAMAIMGEASIEDSLARNRRAFARYART